MIPFRSAVIALFLLFFGSIPSFSASFDEKAIFDAMGRLVSTWSDGSGFNAGCSVLLISPNLMISNKPCEGPTLMPSKGSWLWVGFVAVIYG